MFGSRRMRRRHPPEKRPCKLHHRQHRHAAFFRTSLAKRKRRGK